MLVLFRSVLALFQLLFGLVLRLWCVLCVVFLVLDTFVHFTADRNVCFVYVFY